MPISRKQFERGIDPQVEELMGKINHFLSGHRDEAFDSSELLEAAMGSSREKDKLDAFNEALMKLIEMEMVEKKAIGGIDYYSYQGKKKPVIRYNY